MAVEKVEKKTASGGEPDTTKDKADGSKRRAPGAANAAKKTSAKAASKQAPKDWDHVT